jgi:peptidoglycan hydrolase FlgJ
MNVAAITSVSTSPVSGSSASTTPTVAQCKKAAAQFEAIFVRQLLGQSVGSMMGGTGHASGLMYGDMMTDVLAQKLTAGQGLGLSRMIEKQLTPRGPTPATPTPGSPSSL